jgi:hypothetical protein
VWAKGVALSSSVGTQGGSLPAARVGGRTPSRCGLPVCPDCACKLRNLAVMLCATVNYSGEYVDVDDFPRWHRQDERPLVTQERWSPSGSNIVDESSVGVEGGEK